MIRCSSMLLLHLRPSFKFKPPHLNSPPFEIQIKPNSLNLKLKRQTRCRAVFADDAPFAAAIGACMLTSLVLPVYVPPEEEEDAITSTDSRLAVMGIISFIPYFNWLSWVFAWLDTGKRRYAVYSLVYLAPYFRSNLSLSPEESWMPIASILFCIVHIQLEASIRNGDIQGFRLFSNVANRKKDHLNQRQEMSEGNKKENKNLPSAGEQLRDIGGWGVSQKPKEYRQRLNEDLDNDGEEKKKH